jgi:hypothetical protein
MSSFSGHSSILPYQYKLEANLFVAMNINVPHGKFTLNLLNQPKKGDSNCQTNNRGRLSLNETTSHF